MDEATEAQVKLLMNIQFERDHTLIRAWLLAKAGQVCLTIKLSRLHSLHSLLEDDDGGVHFVRIELAI